ncbi:NADH:ubiquinone reductase (Na(+)-transporting) subunit F [Hydrocarboniclastica marina]|uniref:Oxidoreductase n=1 Tax=Hydrocarboniclastica marina TaxID=2259620 RepID=A0A4P7XMB5_9ALTE|nr:2Fe-2S iron-sulfur cluster binding domain-containing protein [Hydrocarboniclastica marina]QCF28073.1 oxidoreductase [Hydrocarboniclastica marina]|tara:strand:- start:1802 stop:2833 length:1032 start_codon:yes stop_codon:yes gene_type:complete
MFGFFSKSSHELQINDHRVTVKPRETVLQAALSNGINLPYSCKVGGCATCKCRLVSGRVKELTDASYILSTEELQAGYILACQSVPKTDIAVQVELGESPARQIAGRILAQTALTHDIVELQVELEEPLGFRAGQYAQLSLNQLPGITRPYSFAARPDSSQGRLRFFVREVPGGRLSGYLKREGLVGASVRVEGPFGDFYLRDSSQPMLLIAGGSGLAPVLSVLEQALHEDVARPVTLLFGARTQADLYATPEIEAIARQWQAPFRFVQVLSDEPEASNWQGARGWVGQSIERYADASCQAYLCGPPAMIDHSIKQLTSVGVPQQEIFADRFTSVHDAERKTA